MASLVQWLYYSGARDVDGTPIASGSVRFFTPGTSKASSATAYSDAAGTTPLAQPVALDAAGRTRREPSSATRRTPTGSRPPRLTSPGNPPLGSSTMR